MAETVYETPVTSLERLKEIAESIHFKNSIFEDLEISYEVGCLGVGAFGDYYACLKFQRPDILTGRVSTGTGRREIIPCGATYSFAVKTLWLLFDLLIRHETMEAFRVGDARPFNPHTSIEDLVKLQYDKHINPDQEQQRAAEIAKLEARIAELRKT